MKHTKLLAGMALAALLSGCQMMSTDAPVSSGNANCFYYGPPVLVEGECLLPNWVSFGLKAQREDSDWRRDMLKQTADDTAQDRLARAVVLSWSGKDQWKQAAELYKRDISGAPSALQPLLRYWLNDLEARRSLVTNVSSNDQQVQRLRRENAELTKKLDALTAIEESMNARRRTP
ncbi:hypothetical protein [Larsenimonas suaedae]|uniref:YfhG lipoprotein n=1 Tax=Larsenimonas suaedae TaxID=1851019 RepID=A0ABU1GU04_9GAMM|nr:hypothetical protein [Larsenimonas suaedae]MCM2971953.1 hypothetical protein [Larsenimonas suaedae]MDR5895505.1 hypothetical protein [Larsenimonas suaedae]